MTKDFFIAKQSLVNRLMQDIESLHHKVDELQHYLDSLLRSNGSMQGQERADVLSLVSAQREKHLAAAIQEAIAGLEMTRKAIKSKQLERIRHNLIKALSDLPALDSKSVSKTD